MQLYLVNGLTKYVVTAMIRNLNRTEKLHKEFPTSGNCNRIISYGN